MRTLRPSELSAKLIDKCLCLCCCIELDDFILHPPVLHFSPPSHTCHLTAHSTPSLMRSTIHTFLVKFQCTFHLLKKVRCIIIITVVVYHGQHFLITIVIIIAINKIINHNNQQYVSVICPPPLLMTLPHQIVSWIVPTFF